MKADVICENDKCPGKGKTVNTDPGDGQEGQAQTEGEGAQTQGEVDEREEGGLMLSFEELHARHVKLWEFLARNPDKGKNDIPDELLAGSDFYRCFACVAVGRTGEGKEDTKPCTRCPIDWNGKRCISPRAEYQLWWQSLGSDAAKTKRYAEKIRDMAWTKK